MGFYHLQSHLLWSLFKKLIDITIAAVYDALKRFDQSDDESHHEPSVSSPASVKSTGQSAAAILSANRLAVYADIERRYVKSSRTTHMYLFTILA